MLDSFTFCGECFIFGVHVPNLRIEMLRFDFRWKILFWGAVSLFFVEIFTSGHILGIYVSKSKSLIFHGNLCFEKRFHLFALNASDLECMFGIYASKSRIMLFGEISFFLKQRFHLFALKVSDLEYIFGIYASKFGIMIFGEISFF